jgi:hypothetical protein
MKTDWLTWIWFAEIYARWAVSWLVKIGRAPVWRRFGLRK